MNDTFESLEVSNGNLGFYLSDKLFGEECEFLVIWSDPTSERDWAILAPFIPFVVLLETSLLRWLN